MAKIKAALIGSGNIGTDLMIKLAETSALIEPALVIGIDAASEGLAMARSRGIATCHEGIDGAAQMAEWADCDIVFDATSAYVHAKHDALTRAQGKVMIDLTPAAIGPYCVPVVNIDQHLDEPNVNMVTCGGQATIPMVAAVSQVATVHYAEIVASVSSRSAGPGTRANIDEFTETTSKGSETVGGAETGPVRSMLDALEAGRTIRTDFGFNEEASSAITDIAFGFYASQNWDEAAEVFLRLAIEIDPANHKARLFLGSTLEKMGRNDDAMAQYRLIPDSSDYVVSTRLSEARLLFEDEKDDEGLAVLTAIYNAKPSRVTQESVGRAYLILEDYANALTYYDAIIDDMSLSERTENPQAHYVRGICLERLGRWTEAVADFEFVLSNAPDNADALNYLGYTWVDKGVELTRAFDMINKAVELEPDSGAIVDSLGWAYYKLGQYTKALTHLEDAVVLSPSAATIVDHLGDVYWKLGRRKEAGYQWERALTLDPTDEEIETIKAKLVGGLSAVTN